MDLDAAVTEGMPVGRRSRSQGRTIGEGEFALLTTLTWTTDELHTNAEAMRASEFGERLLGGSVLLALVSGLYCQNELFRDLLSVHGMEPIAALGTEARYLGVFRPGDTLWEETEVEAVRASRSRPGCGIISLHDRAYNQRGELLVDSTRAILYGRRGVPRSQS
jgi:acyl dehydratase